MLGRGGSPLVPLAFRCPSQRPPPPRSLCGSREGLCASGVGDGAPALRDSPRAVSGRLFSILPPPSKVGGGGARSPGLLTLRASKARLTFATAPASECTPGPKHRAPGAPSEPGAGEAKRVEAEAPQSRGGEEGGGAGGGKGGEGERSLGGGGGEGASSAVRSWPGLRHTANPEPPRRPGRRPHRRHHLRRHHRRHRLSHLRSRPSRGKRHLRRYRWPPPPRRPGIGLLSPTQPPPEPEREPGRAGLGWCRGGGPGSRGGRAGKTHGRARLSGGPARDCTRTGASPLRAALGLTPGPGG